MTAEEFIILERAGNGYIVKSTEGRGNDELRHVVIEMYVEHLMAPAGTLALDTFFDIDWTCGASGGRVWTPGSSSGSTTGTIRQMSVEFDPISGHWILYVDYVDADLFAGETVRAVVEAYKHNKTGHVTLLK